MIFVQHTINRYVCTHLFTRVYSAPQGSDTGCPQLAQVVVDNVLDYLIYMSLCIPHTPTRQRGDADHDAGTSALYSYWFVMLCMKCQPGSIWKAKWKSTPTQPQLHATSTAPHWQTFLPRLSQQRRVVAKYFYLVLRSTWHALCTWWHTWYEVFVYNHSSHYREHSSMLQQLPP